ncbi:MAG: hypothetical protein C4K60_20630 [Ideonella sp. MAG2]|nr:MAG: hypothetical protein C4K60_20630 [Ideonella sp. MAG2]
MVSDVRQVIRNGMPISFVFAEGDPGQALLRQLGGPALNKLIGRSSVHLATIAHADHTFSARSDRDSLYNCLNSILSLVSVSPAPEDQNLASPTPLQS